MTTTPTTKTPIAGGWTGWLVGATGRLGQPAPGDDRSQLLHRVAELDSTVDKPRVVWLACPSCGLDAGPFTSDEAGQLAGAHDDLHHRGQPTAHIQPSEVTR